MRIEETRAGFATGEGANYTAIDCRRWRVRRGFSEARALEFARAQREIST
jgi:hypothetical protein